MFAGLFQLVNIRFNYKCYTTNKWKCESNQWLFCCSL